MSTQDSARRMSPSRSKWQLIDVPLPGPMLQRNIVYIDAAHWQTVPSSLLPEDLLNLAVASCASLCHDLLRSEAIHFAEFASELQCIPERCDANECCFAVP